MTSGQVAELRRGTWQAEQIVLQAPAAPPPLAEPSSTIFIFVVQPREQRTRVKAPPTAFKATCRWIIMGYSLSLLDVDNWHRPLLGERAVSTARGRVELWFRDRFCWGRRQVADEALPWSPSRVRPPASFAFCKGFACPFLHGGS